MRALLPVAALRTSRLTVFRIVCFVLALWLVSMLSPYRLRIVRIDTPIDPVPLNRPSRRMLPTHNGTHTRNNYEGLDYEDSNDDDEGEDDKVVVEDLNSAYQTSGVATGDVHENASRICTQEERVAHLRAYCANSYKQPEKRRRHSGLSRHIITDPQHNLTYCPLAKVGSTSWKALLVYALNYTDKSWPPVHSGRYLKRAGLRLVKQLTAEDVQRVKESYFKYIVVRHPFDRLVSAWRDKLVQRNSPYRRTLGKRIMEKYRSTTDFGASSEWNDTARFEEFAEYIAEKHLSNTHWTSYHRFCAVCSTTYNGVYRTETTAHDSQMFLLKHLPNYSGKIPFIHSHQSDKNSVSLTQKLLPEFMKVSPKALEYLFLKYGPDLEMFGYVWDNHTGTAKCAIKTEDGSVCC